MIINEKEYFLIFHVICVHQSKKFYSVLLHGPWLKATKVKIDLGGEKFHIIYGPIDYLTKFFIQIQRLALKKTSINSFEDEIHILQPKQ